MVFNSKHLANHIYLLVISFFGQPIVLEQRLYKYTTLKIKENRETED